MKKVLWLTSFLLLGLLLGGGLWYAMWRLPHMRQQPSLRPYETELPTMPSDLVPYRIDSPDLAVDRETDPAELGRLYYGRHCQPCHGLDGHGHSPVGESFTPAPGDLTRPGVQAMSDEALLRRMITGIGHEPTIEHDVSLDRRRLILRQVRALAAE